MRCRTVGALLLGLLTVWMLLPGAGVAAGAAPPRLIGWGGNGEAIGDGTVTSKSLPTATDMSGALAGRIVTAVDVGGSGGTICAVANGSAYCWGSSLYGLVGTPGGAVVRPQALPPGAMAGRTITAVSVGGHQACAVAAGRAYCWGDSNGGGLGNGVTRGGWVYQPVAVATDGVLAGRTVTAISSGADHTCAAADGKAYCWGLNRNGQLGDGTTVNASKPVAVDASGALGGKRVTAVAAAQDHTCAIADGGVYCWGRGGNGQIGDGTRTDRSRPVAVVGLPAGMGLLDTDRSRSCAATRGAVYCWGQGWSGGVNAQAGPLTAGSLAGRTITALDLGAHHACAVAGGGVHCWGDWPWLGVGATRAQPAPVAVTTGALAGRTAAGVAVGGGITMVLTTG